MSDEEIARSLERWVAGQIVVPVEEGVQMMKRAAIVLRSAASMALALESVEAALGDRLLAKGPLSKPYARAVTRDVRAAVRAYREGK